MDKTAIKNFAVWARKKLISDTMNKASLLGISEAGIQPAVRSGNDWLVDIPGLGRKQVLSDEVAVKRERLVLRLQERMKGEDYKTAYRNFMEEVSYTWFNRLIALRFMEVNDYIPGHVRPLSSMKPGKKEPDLVSDPFSGRLRFSDEETAQLQKWQLTSDSDAIFNVVFLKQCNALHDLLPKLFEKTDEETELLLSLSVMDKEGVVYRLTHDIPEEDWKDQVQIIGWLYQYYNTEPKDKIDSQVANGIKVAKWQLAAKTEIFTPDWVVRFMVENSIGRIWLEGHNSKRLKDNWLYYLEPSVQDDSVNEEIQNLTQIRRHLRVENLKIIDPCMGSGHIIAYAFDVLMQIYKSEGYDEKSAVEKIVKNNIFGLDIDLRAAQIAYFSIMMKSRSYDRNFLRKGIEPHVFAIKESNNFPPSLVNDFCKGYSELRSDLEYVLNSMKNARAYGSLIDMKNVNFSALFKRANEIIESNSLITVEVKDLLVPILKVARLLAQKYSVVITNPPYLGINKINEQMASFMKNEYPEAKSDLFSCFIVRGNNMTIPGGINSIVTMQSWMFLSSYEKLRKSILNKYTILNLMHMNNQVMGIAFGTAVTIIENRHISSYKGTYLEVKYSDIIGDEPYQFPVPGNRFAVISPQIFFKMPGNPIAYWADNSLINAYLNGELLENLADVKQGLATGCNDLFLKLWFEVNRNRCKLDSKNLEDFLGSGKKWIPYNKGGSRRQWYGNYDYLVNWERDGYAIKHFTNDEGKLRSAVRNPGTYFKDAMTWGLITSGGFSIRYRTSGGIHDVSGMSAFFNGKCSLKYLLAVMSTPIANYVFKLLNPTVNLQIGDFKRFPVLMMDNSNTEKVIGYTNDCINLSKEDWDMSELSWNFQEHPMVTKNTKEQPLKAIYEEVKTKINNRFNTLRTKQETINQLFIDYYQLSSVLDWKTLPRDITVAKVVDNADSITNDLKENPYVLTKFDVAKSLISYAVGCMVGRYSLDVPGLAYAGGEWDGSKYVTFKPDDDNVIPITDENYFADDITGRFEAWLKAAYGEKHLQENLRWVADALGKKGPARDVIREYFLKDFYKDHVKTYQKRPIYWLYDSGKKNGFKALIYMHRYNKETTGVVSSKYVNRMTHLYENQIMQCENIMSSGDAREAAKAEKRKEKLTAQLRECREYYTAINHLALAYIDIDLDDGVKVNYEKVQTDKEGKKFPLLAKI